MSSTKSVRTEAGRRAHLVGNLLCLVAAISLPGNVRGEDADGTTVRIVSSDLLEGALRIPLQDLAAERDIAIALAFPGSRLALQAIGEGDAEIAIVARTDAGMDTPEGFGRFDFGYQVSVVVVHRTNPLQEVTLRQVGSLFGGGEGIGVSEWGALGLQGPWKGRQIAVHAYIGPENIALELLRHTCLQDSRIKPTITYHRSDEGLRVGLEKNPSAVGVSSHVPDGDLRALLVSADEGSFAFDPSADNVYFGDYPMVLPFVLLFDRDGGSVVREVVRMLLSDSTARRLEEYRFTPVPRNFRQQFALEVDLGE